MTSPAMESNEQRVKRGRPPGEVTPEGLIRQELIAHLKLYRRTREIIEQRMDVEGLSVDDLTKYMELLRKGIVEMAKPIVPQAQRAEAKPQRDEEDAEKVLANLLEGRSS